MNDVHFGLGDATTVDELIVTWPSGDTETLSAVVPGQTLELVEGSVTSSERIESVLPGSVILGEIYPNPFNPTARLSLEVGTPGPVRLEVVDVRGRTVRVLRDEWTSAGTHDFTFQASDLPGGIYLIVARTVDGLDRRTAVLVK